MDNRLKDLIEELKQVEGRVYDKNAKHFAQIVKEDAKYLREVAEEIVENTKLVWTRS